MKRGLFLSLLFAAHFAHAALDPVVDAEDRRQVSARALTAGNHAKSAATRLKVAVAYGRILDPKGVDPLLKLLKDHDVGVRSAAAFALGQFGWQSEFSAGREPEIQKALSAALSDKKIAPLVVEALGKVSLARAPELIGPSLEDKSLRAEAIMALFRARMILKLRGMDKEVTELPAPLTEKLLGYIDQEVPVRRNVAYYFARVADARAEVAMTKLAADSDLWTRMYAVMALAKMKSKTSQPAFINALRDADYHVRLAALTAIVATGATVAPTPALAADENYLVRAAYVQALDPKNVNRKQFENEKSPTVQAEVLKAIAKTKKEDLEAWLKPFLEDSSWILREATVSASEGLAADKREAFLLTLLNDQDINVRGAALEALGALPTATAFATLKSELARDTLVERGTAIGALKDRKEPEIPALTWQSYQASLDRRWVEIRQDMVEIFTKTVNDETTGYLKQVYQKDGDASVQDKALKALVERGVTDLPVRVEAKLSFSPYRDKLLTKNPVVLFHTARGDFRVECFAKEAPIHVASLIGLVRKHAYDGLIWHRVVPNFVVQGGDPDGTGWGDAGYSLRNEINRERFERGALGMPRSSGFDTGGSQLFFMPVPTPHLDGQYTVFGRIVAGVEVIDRLERGDTILSARVLP